MPILGIGGNSQNGQKSGCPQPPYPRVWLWVGGTCGVTAWGWVRGVCDVITRVWVGRGMNWKWCVRMGKNGAPPQYGRCLWCDSMRMGGRCFIASPPLQNGDDFSNFFSHSKNSKGGFNLGDVFQAILTKKFYRVNLFSSVLIPNMSSCWGIFSFPGMHSRSWVYRNSKKEIFGWVQFDIRCMRGRDFVPQGCS